MPSIDMNAGAVASCPSEAVAAVPGVAVVLPVLLSPPELPPELPPALPPELPEVPAGQGSVTEVPLDGVMITEICEEQEESVVWFVSHGADHVEVNVATAQPPDANVS